MNHTYRLVWNEAAQRYVPAAESARSRGKRGGCRALKPLRAIILAVAFGGTYVCSVDAAPTGGTVVAGQGTISATGSTTTVHQQSQNLSLNWLGFSIAPTETVQFVQPSTTAIALNRVIGTEASQIYGHLVANGQVFLINPNGVLFAPGAQVDVGSLVASTLNISNADFLAGNYKFQTGSSSSVGSASPASVINQGSITAAAGGSVALLGGQVSNQGTITARLGTVALAAGSAMTLDFRGNRLMSVQVDQSAVGALAENRQLIQADGGMVIMTAAARDALLNTVVNNTGVIEARTIQDQGGEIKLLGSPDGGRVNVDGTLDASAPNGGNGGSIETSGTHVEIADTAHITTAAPTGKTGTWLVDPTDFTIAASGGDITGAKVSSALATTNVTYASSSGSVSGSGDINVNDSVTWSSGTTLTLNAVHNVNVTAPITNTGSPAGGGVTLRADSGGACVTGAAASACGTVNFSGSGSITATNVNIYYNPTGSNYATPTSYSGNVTGTLNAYMLVNDGTELQAINTNLAGSYAQGTNFNYDGHVNPNGIGGYFGFATLGNGSTPFTGVFDGLNHTITDLTINRPNSSNVGLFYNGGTIRNVGLVSSYVTGFTNAGSLAGYNTGTINNCYVTLGTVTSTSSQIGGLVGQNDGGSISNSYALETTVSGVNYVGGLVGYMPHAGTISGTYADGTVTSSGTSSGGLVGYMSTSSTAVPTITNSYATGTVNGNGDVGGLLGTLLNGTITNSYSAGAVTGTTNVGGLVGSNRPGTSVTNSFWNITTSGQNTSAGGATGMTTAQMQAQANFTSATAANGNANPSWDFTGSWRMYDGYTAPLLKAFLTPLTITADNISSTYTGITSTAALQNPVYSVPDSVPGIYLGEIKNSATAYSNDRNVGNYAPVLWSDQQGYDITVINGNLKITPANLTVTGATASDRAYNGTTTATVSGGTLSGTVFGTDSVTLTQTGTFSDKNVGNNKSVSETFALSGTDAANYSLSNPSASTTASITAATLTVSGSPVAADRIYNGTTTATVSGGTLSGTVFGSDAVTLTQAGTFSDKNVGTNKSVSESFGLSGTDAANYSLSNPSASTTASITAATLTVSGSPVAADRTYNGTTTATVSGGTLSGTVFGSDSVSLTQTGNFSDKNVGNNKTVTEAFTLAGTDAGNYSLSNPSASTTASITPATLTAGEVAASDQVYDGTTLAAISVGASSGVSLSGVIGSDAVTLTEVGAFSDKNVGTNKTVTVTFGLTGSGAGNYTLASNNASTTANITPKTLTVRGTPVAADRSYNGTTTATVFGGILSGTVFGTDSVTLTQTGNFSNKNVGTNKSVSETFTLAGTDAANYSLSNPTASTTASITAATLTVGGSAVAADRIYNGTTTATVSGGTLSGTVFGSDAVTLTQTGSFSDKNVGTNKSVSETFTLAGTDATNYAISNPTASTTANITAATLTVSGSPVATDRIYNGTTAATVSGGTLSGTVFGSDSVTLTQTGSFSDKNVGTNKSVSETFILAGTDATNYSLSNPTASTTANITAATLTVGGSAVAADRTYNGTTTATVSGGTLSGTVFGSDAVTLTQTGSFSDKNVGTNKTVTETFVLAGSDAANYTLSSNTASTTASITPATLTVSGATVADKVYDGKASAVFSGGSLSGVLGTDAVSLIQSAAFSDKNVGTNKTVTESFSLTGTDAGNYTVANASTTASITPATLTVSGASAANKVYDSTVTATVSGGALSGVFGSDTVSLTQAGAFGDKNVANNKTVTESFSLTGTDAGNYTLASNTSSTTANITPATLTVSGSLVAADRIYNGTTTATVSGGTLSGTVFGSDAVTLTQTGSFSNKNVGTNKSVSETFTLAGTDAANYSLSNPTASTTANITPATLTVSGSPVAADRIYNGTTTATVSGGTLSGTVFGSDAVTLTQTGSFSDKNVGNNKSVSETFALSGTDASNYAISNPTASTTASITAATLTVGGSAVAADRIYNGTTTATVSGGTLSGTVFGSDAVTLTQTGSFSDKNVGNNKSVSETFALSGTDASNYAISNPTASTTASITAATLTVGGSAVAADRIYNGTTTATVSGGTLSGTVFGSDAVTLTQTGSFSDKNVGNNKSVSETFTLAGTDATNYAISNPTASTTANITAATLTVSGSPVAADRIYNGTTAATVSGGTLSGTVFGSDSVTLTQTGSFSDKNVGTNKSVSETFILAGTDATNYSLSNPTASTTANITAATLTVGGSAVAADRTYNGTTTATVSGGTLSGTVFGSDAVTLTQTGSFSDKNVGTNKSVSETFALSGTDASNYAISNPTTSTTASITAATLTVSGTPTAADRIYNGTTTATVSGGTLSGSVFGTDSVSLTQAGTFSDKNVGTNKSVSETFTLAGTDAANYALSSNTASTTASITPATLTVSGATAASKTYDGSLNTTISGGVLSGVISSDSVGLLQTGLFSDRNAGTNKTVTESFGLTGTDSGNYTLANGTAQTTANITPKTLTVIANGQTKTYGQADPTLSYASSGYVSGTFNGVTVNDTAASVLTGAPIRIAGETVHGGPYAIELGSLASNGNYTISYTPNFLKITPATITLSGITANDKPYDATVTATLNTGAASFVGRIGSDTLGVTATGDFVNASAGTGKTVTISNLTLIGAASGNYVLAASGNESSTTASITPDNLTITANDATKAVGAPNPALTLAYGGFVAGESASSLTTQPTVSTTAGTTSPAGNYTITASGAVDPNYTFTYVPGTLSVVGNAATASQSYTGTLANLSNVGDNGTSGSGSGVSEGEAHGAALDCSGYVHCVEIPGNPSDTDGEDLRGKSRGALSLWSLIILDGGIRLPVYVQ